MHLHNYTSREAYRFQCGTTTPHAFHAITNRALYRLLRNRGAIVILHEIKLSDFVQQQPSTASKKEDHHARTTLATVPAHGQAR